MKPRVRITDEATKDIKEIWKYQVKTSKNKEIARNTVNRIREEIRTLRDNAMIGHTRPDLTDEDLKFLAVYSYLIVFRRSEGEVQIIAVLHMAREAEEILKDRP